MIHAFLFDIGNVLLKFDFSKAMRAIAAQSAVNDPIEALGRIDQIKASYEDGQIDRAAFLRGCIDALTYHGSEADFVAAWSDIFELNEPMAGLVERLASSGHRLYLLSNTNCIHHDWFTSRYAVFGHFGGGTFSHIARASKPGREIYEIACRSHGLVPAETLFIDDLLPNIEAACGLGFQTHHYHAEKHAALLEELSAAGIDAAASDK
jgi:glucose-1-phosphatase